MMSNYCQPPATKSYSNIPSLAPGKSKSSAQTLANEGDPAREAALARTYRPPVKQRRKETEAKRMEPGFPPRRWVVERTHSWLNRFRKLLVRFEKTEAS